MKLQSVLIAIASAIFVAAIAPVRAGAQYVPIPAETGLQLRNDVNARFSGAVPITSSATTITVTGSFAAGPTTPTNIDCDATLETFGITLDAALSTVGKTFTIKRVDATPGHYCQVSDAFGFIDGTGSYNLTVRNQWITVYSDGTTWHIPSITPGIANPLTANLSTGGNAITGSATSGGDQINNMSVNGVFNVKAYGAKCDGSTDDAAAIQSAINAADTAETAAGSPPVMFPPTPSSSCKISRPLVNFATGSGSDTVPAIYGAGATSTTIAPTFTGPAIILVGQNAAGLIKTSLTGNIIPSGAGNSMTWASGSSDYFDLSEVLPTTGTTPVGVFNGASQWDIRAFIKPADFSQTRCLWASTGAFNNVLNTGGDVGGGGMGYLCTEADAKLHGMLNVGGSLIKVISTSALTVNTVYEVELNLDSSHNVNLFVGTGGTVTRVAQTASGGTTIKQRPDENNVMGAAFSEWPYLGNASAWQGAMQSVQISNIARNTGASYTQDTANFAADGSTLFLDNFDLNQFVGGAAVNPTVQVDAPSNAWMALHLGEGGCCGNTYNVSGLNIAGSESVGVYADGAAIDVSHITTNAKMYGIETNRGATFNSFIHDMTEANGVGGRISNILAMGGITFIRNVIVIPSMFPIYTIGTVVDGAYTPGDTHNMCEIGIEAEGAPAPAFNITNITADNENGGTVPIFCIKGTNPVTISSSFSEPIGASDVQLIGPVGSVTLRGNSLNSAATFPVVDATYATSVSGESILFDNNSYVNGGVTNTSSPPSGYTNFGFPYSVIDHTPQFHHLQVPVVPTPESRARNSSFFCANTNTCAYPVPPDAHVGDVEIAAPAIEGGAPGIVTAPAGWTLACTANNGANGEYVSVYWHVVTANDTATFTRSSANTALNFCGGITNFSGINQLNPVDICVASIATGTTSISLTGGTSGDQNDIDVFLADDGNQVLLPSPPVGVTLDFSGQGNTLSIWSYLPGSTTIPSVTVNSPATNNFAGVQLLLRPALSQSSLMTAGQGSPPLYQGEPGATVGSLVLQTSALATFGTCGSTNAGIMARENNSTAACSAGATATNAGMTPCFIVCNGANWLQTGY